MCAPAWSESETDEDDDAEEVSGSVIKMRRFIRTLEAKKTGEWRQTRRGGRRRSPQEKQGRGTYSRQLTASHADRSRDLRSRSPRDNAEDPRYHPYRTSRNPRERGYEDSSRSYGSHRGYGQRHIPPQGSLDRRNRDADSRHDQRGKERERLEEERVAPNAHFNRRATELGTSGLQTYTHIPTSVLTDSIRDDPMQSPTPATATSPPPPGSPPRGEGASAQRRSVLERLLAENPMLMDDFGDDPQPSTEKSRGKRPMLEREENLREKASFPLSKEKRPIKERLNFPTDHPTT